jgi:rare lipoprotein A
MRSFRLLAGLALCLTLTALAAQAQTPTSTYTVKKGDTLYSIARAHGMTVDELRTMNRLSGNTIYSGQSLTVRTPLTGPLPTLEDSRRPRPNDPPAPPTAGDRTTPRTDREEPSNRDAAAFTPTSRARKAYTVQPGDTYYSIGVALGVPAYAIFALNDGDGAPLEANRTIWVPDTAVRRTDGQTLVYRVKRGDTLFSIAREHGLTLADLREANDLTGSQLRIDQVLTIPPPRPTPDAQPSKLPPLFEKGIVDVYPDTFAGRVLTSGRPYDPTRFTVSHPDLPMESIVLLTNPATGMSSFAEVSDRGPADTRFIMDISSAVARELGLSVGSRDEIQVRVVE